MNFTTRERNTDLSLSRNDNNDLLRKLDGLLALLQQHTNNHENCCLKNILKLIGDNHE
jgi:hypothetical protein